MQRDFLFCLRTTRLMRVDHSRQAPHPRLRGRRSRESFRMSTAERELKRTTLRPWTPRGAGTHRGLHDAAACLPLRHLSFFFLGLIKHFGVPSGATRLSPRGTDGKVKQERQRGLDCLSERERGERGQHKERTNLTGLGVVRHGSWGVGNMRIGFLCFPPAHSCRARLHQPLARLCRILEGTSVSTPRDKRQQEADPPCIILFAHLLGPPPRGASVSRPNELFSYVLPACLPHPVDVWCSSVLGCRRKAQPRVVAYAASGFPSTHKCVCVSVCVCAPLRPVDFCQTAGTFSSGQKKELKNRQREKAKW